MKTIKTCVKWLVRELKWFTELIYLHLRVFVKENEEMFSYDKSKLKNASYRFVFSIGLGTILFFFSLGVYSASKVIIAEYPDTKEYIASKLTKKVVIVNEPVIEEVELSGNSGELESNMQETHNAEEKINVEMSAYTSREQETDGSPCISADNSNICEYDGCVVASNDFPLQTIVNVDGFGECTVKDRMNSRYSFLKTGQYNMDIYMKYDLQKALNFGRQKIDITLKK